VDALLTGSAQVEQRSEAESEGGVLGRPVEHLTGDRDEAGERYHVHHVPEAARRMSSRAASVPLIVPSALTSKAARRSAGAWSQT
jgi:hypothetical protein